MIKYTKFGGDAFDEYKKAVSRKTDKTGKARLVAIEKDVEQDFDEYSSKFNSSNVCTIKPHGYIGEVKGDLLGLYSYSKPIVKDLVEWHDKHVPRPYIGQCPYCSITRANSMDHYLPKEIYPEFSINVNNLLPCCTTCNDKKGTDVKDANGDPIFINFYYDILPDKQQYLFVTIKNDANGIPEATFYLKNSGKIAPKSFDLICRHFSKLDLISRLNEKSINDIVSIKDSLVPLARDCGIPYALKHLLDYADMTAQSYQSCNHYSVVLMKELSISTDFSTYLSSLL